MNFIKEKQNIIIASVIGGVLILAGGTYSYTIRDYIDYELLDKLLKVFENEKVYMCANKDYEINIDDVKYTFNYNVTNINGFDFCIIKYRIILNQKEITRTLLKIKTFTINKQILKHNYNGYTYEIGAFQVNNSNSIAINKKVLNN